MGVKAIAGEVLGEVVLFSFCSVFVVKQFAKFSLLTVKGSPVRAFWKNKNSLLFRSEATGSFTLYSKRDLNPHSHHWPRDFKSLVSTDSTIRAR